MAIRNLIVFFLFSAYTLQAQLQHTIDSLENVLSLVSPNSKEQVDVLNQLGYQYWVRDSETSAEYGENAFAISQNLDYTQGAAMAKRILGVSYWTFGEPKKALENLRESQQLYESIEDMEGATNALMNSGMVYADIGEFERALKIYDQSIRQFSKLDLKRRIATTFTKIGTVQLQEGKIHDAKESLINALTMHSEDGYLYGQSEAHNRLGRLYLDQGELEQAEYHLKRAVDLSQSISDEDGIISSIIQTGRLQRLRGNVVRADSLLSRALVQARSKRLKKYQLEALKELKLLKRQEGKLDESLDYYDEFIILRDSLFSTEKSKQIAALEFDNELRQKENKIALLQETKRSRTLINVFLSLLLVALSVIALLMLRHQRQREKREMELLKSKEALARTELENAELKQRELQQQLEFKNKELTSYTLNFAQKNELFVELLEQVDTLRKANPAQQSKILSNIRKKIKSHSNVNNDWEDFKRYFEEVHSDFYKRLKEKHPEISANDLKICALARLNLSIKETANVLGISPESAKTARYRLRKKLNLPPEIELLDYLLKLEQ